MVASDLVEGCGLKQSSTCWWAYGRASRRGVGVVQAVGLVGDRLGGGVIGNRHQNAALFFKSLMSEQVPK